mmetsp:Transcript_7069/g.25159  ORF Transcript_7069/g.25159 Transcript_7069/m.25159 type:complete len:309 (+) Transcript_7069:3112-4038(+)
MRDWYTVAPACMMTRRTAMRMVMRPMRRGDLMVRRYQCRTGRVQSRKALRRACAFCLASRCFNRASLAAAASIARSRFSSSSLWPLAPLASLLWLPVSLALSEWLPLRLPLPLELRLPLPLPLPVRLLDPLPVSPELDPDGVLLEPLACERSFLMKPNRTSVSTSCLAGRYESHMTKKRNATATTVTTARMTLSSVWLLDTRPSSVLSFSPNTRMTSCVLPMARSPKASRTVSAATGSADTAYGSVSPSAPPTTGRSPTPSTTCPVAMACVTSASASPSSAASATYCPLASRSNDVTSVVASTTGSCT